MAKHIAPFAPVLPPQMHLMNIVRSHLLDGATLLASQEPVSDSYATGTLLCDLTPVVTDCQPVAVGSQVFQPDSGCTYHQYGRSEILEFYQDSATDILVIGDSFMRQLFVRLLHLMRGQVALVTSHLHNPSIDTVLPVMWDSG